MNTETNAIVTEMPSASVTPDGELVEMELKYSDNSTQILRFQPKTFLRFLSNVYEMFFEARTQKESLAGHVEIQPLPASATFAQEAVGGDAVLLGMRLRNNLPVHFAVSIDEAEKLHKQIGKAIKKAKQQSYEKRH